MLLHDKTWFAICFVAGCRWQTSRSSCFSCCWWCLSMRSLPVCWCRCNRRALCVVVDCWACVFLPVCWCRHARVPRCTSTGSKSTAICGWRIRHFKYDPHLYALERPIRKMRITKSEHANMLLVWLSKGAWSVCWHVVVKMTSPECTTDIVFNQYVLLS